MLDARNTFHYHNLPDLTFYVRLALTHQNFNHNTITMYMGIFCIHNKMRYRNNHKLSFVERKAFINLLHGVLLGLYPFNLQRHTFATRCALAARIREFMIHDEFHENLMQLATIEYLNNVLHDFCPVESAMLVSSPTIRFVINQICDSFRQSVVLPLDLEAMNHSAADAVNNIHRYLKQLAAYHVPRRQPPAPKLTPQIITHALQLPLVPHSSKLAQIHAVAPTLSITELQVLVVF